MADGYIETIQATVSDSDHDFEDLEVIWYVDEEVVCDWDNPTSSGTASCDIVFQEEDQSVVAEVRDPSWSTGSYEISIDVLATDAPVVDLLTPVSEMGITHLT